MSRIGDIDILILAGSQMSKPLAPLVETVRRPGVTGFTALKIGEAAPRFRLQTYVDFATAYDAAASEAAHAALIGQVVRLDEIDGYFVYVYVHAVQTERQPLFNALGWFEQFPNWGIYATWELERVGLT